MGLVAWRAGITQVLVNSGSSCARCKSGAAVSDIDTRLCSHTLPHSLRWGKLLWHSVQEAASLSRGGLLGSGLAEPPLLTLRLQGTF